jgi:hypothetical protein
MVWWIFEERCGINKCGEKVGAKTVVGERFFNSNAAAN